MSMRVINLTVFFLHAMYTYYLHTCKCLKEILFPIWPARGGDHHHHDYHSSSRGYHRERCCDPRICGNEGTTSRGVAGIVGGGPQCGTALLQQCQPQKEASGHKHFYMVARLRVPGRGTGYHTHLDKVAELMGYQMIILRCYRDFEGTTCFYSNNAQYIQCRPWHLLHNILHVASMVGPKPTIVALYYGIQYQFLRYPKTSS